MAKPIQYFAGLLLLMSTLSVRCMGASAPAGPGREAVERGMEFLQKAAFDWKAAHNCAACHHASMTLWAFNEAREHGYAVDEKGLQEITCWTFSDMKANSLAEQAPPRNVVNLGWVYALLSIETGPKPHLAAGEHKLGLPCQIDGTNLDAIISARETLLRQIVNKQAADGSWGRPLDERVPLGGPIDDVAALSGLALRLSGDSSRAVTNCVGRAATWLAANADKTSRQGKNLRLLTDAFEGRAPRELRGTIASICAEQNEDGGWSQTPDIPSDAYATGQTLYVLSVAGVSAHNRHMKRAVEFLVRTQGQDGSWRMTSRVHAKNLSPITGAGTAWAVLGLVRASR